MQWGWLLGCIPVLLFALWRWWSQFYLVRLLRPLVQFLQLVPLLLLPIPWPISSAGPYPHLDPVLIRIGTCPPVSIPTPQVEDADAATIYAKCHPELQKLIELPILQVVRGFRAAGPRHGFSLSSNLTLGTQRHTVPCRQQQ